MSYRISQIGVVSVFLFLTLMMIGSVQAQEDGIVSFNKASAEELMAIEDIDIPESLAKAIVDYRTKNGPFKSCEDLLKVPGMTKDFLEDLNPQEIDGDVIYDPEAEPALAPSKC